KNLVGFVNGIHEGEAFLCGLVHDIGKLVMLDRNNKLYRDVLLRAGSGEKSFVELEDETFGLNHVEVGQWVAERWNFPEEVVQAVARHHRPWPQRHGNLQRFNERWLLVKIADTLVHASGIGHPGSYSGLRMRAQGEIERCKLELGTSIERLNEVIKKNESEFEKNFGMYEDDL
ncbi:MAG: HDOD domain-containing protein, partial [Bdellovibrionales bacterium]|nr:HDOD domain-containing protein [Bdellovibrionales bacterium]